MIQRNTSSSEHSLWRWSKWLSSISERDAELLKQTPEFDRFLMAMECLEQAHIVILNTSTVTTPASTIIEDEEDIVVTRPPSLCLMQNSLLSRVFDFLECRDLVKSAGCCSRFHHLAEETANVRTRDMLGTRQLLSRMQLLRAKEQLDGIATSPSYRTIPIPVLLPSRRIIIAQCGDEDFNGIYCCTEANLNGFEFTKYRYTDENGRLLGNDLLPDSERQLKCRIGKRFSGQTLWWYLSKEEAPIGTDPPARSYRFCATLMTEQFAPADLLPFPSLSSVLLQSERSWQNLPADNEAPVQVPVVELLN